MAEERQKDAYETAEECEEFSSLLFQLGNVLQVIFLYLYKIHRPLLRSFDVIDQIFARNPILISLKRSHSL